MNTKPTFSEIQSSLNKANVENTENLTLDAAIKIHSSVIFSDAISAFAGKIVNAETSGVPISKEDLIQSLADIDSSALDLFTSFGVTRRDIAAHNTGKTAEKKPSKTKKTQAEKLQDVKDAAKKAVEKQKSVQPDIPLEQK